MQPARKNENVRDFDCQPGQRQIACSRCTLRELCLPRGLPAAEVERFEQIVYRSRAIQRGEHLFRAGHDFRSVAAVRTGCFKSYVIDQTGQEHVLGFHLPGEIVGLDAVHSRRHTANVVALDTSAVCGLAFDSISTLASRMPQLQSEMFRMMSRRITELETIAGDHSADERIAIFLVWLSERFSSRGYSENEFTLAMSRGDVASYLRLATETVSRVLARFQKAGWLQVNRKKVTILDLEKLKQLSGQKKMK